MTVDEENQFICEKLLGWTRREEDRESMFFYWMPPGSDDYHEVTPTFETGDNMLLILEAFANLHLAKFPAYFPRFAIDWDRTKHPSIPSAVRAAALAYIGSLKSE